MGISQMKKITLIIPVTVIALWVPPAMAYLDPGSGSAIMSAVIGLLVAVGLTAKTYWYKTKSFFKGKNTAQESGSDPASEDQ
jgi:hypothetical protein